MRASSILGFLMLGITGFGCATTSNYEAKVNSWKGVDADMLVSSWGQPDDIQKLSNSDRMFIYSRLRHPPLAFAGPHRDIASVGPAPLTNTYIKCATYFEVDAQNKIKSTLIRGDECKWKD
jgi:hypothetical protein